MALDPTQAFQGAPTEPGTAPVPAAAPAAATAPLTGDLGATPAGMPTFQGGTSTSKTFGGIPTSQFPTSITTPGYDQTKYGHRGDQTSGTTIPAYHDGDQWLPLQEHNPDAVRQIQTQLVEAGLIQAQKVHFGIWDKYSADAYAKVLASANTMGVNAATALDNFVASSTSALPNKIANPDDLAAMAQQVAQNTLGRNLNPAELATFTTALQAAYSGEAAPPQTAAGLGQLGQQVLTKEKPNEAAASSLHAVSQRALQVLSAPAVTLPGPQ